MSDKVHYEFTKSGARSLIRIMTHVIGNAEGTSASAYGIDVLCRADGAARWRELRDYLQVGLDATREPAKPPVGERERAK